MSERLWPLFRALVLHALSWSGWLAFLPTLALFIVTRKTLGWPPIDLEGKILVSSTDVRVVMLLIGQLTSLFVFLVAWKFVERKSLKDMLLCGLHNLWSPFLIGFLSGAMAILLVTAGMLVFGGLSLERQAQSFSWTQLLTSIVFLLVCCLLGPFVEEVESRGYLFQNTQRGWGKVVAVVVTALVFSLRHALNPHVNAIGIINLFLISVAITMGMLRARSLWYAVGWHISWNLLTVLVLGTPNSGFWPAEYGLSGLSVFSSSLTGRSFLTGGGFGLEGSVVTTLVIAFQILVIWRLQ